MLENFLRPDENVVFKGTFMWRGKNSELWITNLRIILGQRRGRIWKKNRVICENIDTLTSLGYYEVGIIRKRAKIELRFPKRKVELLGTIENVISLYNTLVKGQEVEK